MRFETPYVIKLKITLTKFRIRLACREKRDIKSLIFLSRPKNQESDHLKKKNESFICIDKVLLYDGEQNTGTTK